MGVLSLDAYTAAQLQVMLALLAEAERAGVGLGELRALVARSLPQAPQAAVRREMTGTSPRICPSCGRGPLAPVANRDGLRILGCRLCRYSEVA